MEEQKFTVNGITRRIWYKLYTCYNQNYYPAADLPS